MKALSAVLLLTGCLDYGALSKGRTAVDGGGTSDGDIITTDAAGQGDASPQGDAAPVVADLTPSTSDMACTQYTHSNGLGKTWTDCVPLGTHNAAQALKACAASFDQATTCVNPIGGCAGSGIYGYVSASNEYTWVFSGALVGKTISGDCASPVTEVTWN